MTLRLAQWVESSETKMKKKTEWKEVWRLTEEYNHAYVPDRGGIIFSMRADVRWVNVWGKPIADFYDSLELASGSKIIGDA